MKTIPMRFTDSPHSGRPVRDAAFKLGEVLTAEGTTQIDPGTLFTGVMAALEKMPEASRLEVVERLAGAILPVGWTKNAAGQVRTGDRTTRDLARDVTTASHMRDRIQSLNEMNERFWNRNDAA